MKQHEVALSILAEMAKYKIKHPKFDNIITLLQDIKDDKIYRYQEENDVLRDESLLTKIGEME